MGFEVLHERRLRLRIAQVASCCKVEVASRGQSLAEGYF